MKKILRRRQVEDITGFSGRTIDRKEKAGDFPQRVQLGPNSIGWIESEVVEWIETRRRGGCGVPSHLTKATL